MSAEEQHRAACLSAWQRIDVLTRGIVTLDEIHHDAIVASIEAIGLEAVNPHGRNVLAGLRMIETQLRLAALASKAVHAEMARYGGWMEA